MEYEHQKSIPESQTSSIEQVDSGPEEDDDEDIYQYYDDEMEESQPLEERDPEWYEYICMSTDDVWALLQEEVQMLSRCLQVDNNIARSLLQCANWQQEIAISKFNEDKTQLYIDAHIYPSTPQGSLGFGIECPVCLCTTGTIQLLGLECGHMFCSDCWTKHIIAKLERGLAIDIECLQCDVYVTLDVIEKLLKPLTQEYTRYLKIAVSQYVESHHLLRWCPGKDCNMIFHVKESLPKRVQCTSCESLTCFKCGEEYHSPTECETFKEWLAKCQDDSETANYIAANTKDCPKCTTAIEKNGGCNHMHCTKCKHDFCWMCMGDWSAHNSEYYECSRYKSNPDIGKEKITSARAALKKYLFYYERWDNHHRSLLLEEQTLLKIQTHIHEKVACGEGTWIDWQYLVKAADLLRKCRYTLKYTYPRAYWMEGDNKQLFEYQQAQLELEIENLSWKVERANITDRADLEQQMNITEIRRVTLLRDFTIQ